MEPGIHLKSNDHQVGIALPIRNSGCDLLRRKIRNRRLERD